MPELPNAARRVAKANYVPLKVQVPDNLQGQAAQRFGYVRQLNLQPGKVAALPHGAPSSVSR
jgi:hypothetical protein